MSLIVLFLIEFVFDKPIPWWLWLLTVVNNVIVSTAADNKVNKVRVVK